MALVISVLMLAAMLPAVTIIASDGPVCEIGSVQYNDFETAWIAAISGDTITLLSDINFPKGIYIPDNNEITFDLNGFTFELFNTEHRIIHMGTSIEISYISTGVEVRSGSKLHLVNAGEFNVTSHTTGVYALPNSKVTLTNVKSDAGDSIAAAVLANNGGEVTVTGNVETTSVNGTGVYVGGNAKVTVDGVIYFPEGATYILIGYDEYKSKSGGILSSDKPGYLEYTNGSCFVWVKIVEDPCAGGHDFIDDPDSADYIAPNCTVDGFMPTICSVCGEDSGGYTLPAIGHTPGSRAVVKDPTRTEKGEWEIRCEVCDDLLESGEIDELGVTDPITNIDCFATIQETFKGSKVWAVTFTVTVTLIDEDGEVVGTEVVEYVIYLDGNNGNLSGSYTFADDHDLTGYTLVYDIKGNGSNIKEFYIIQE